MKHSTLSKRALRQLAILACTPDTNHVHVARGNAKTSFGKKHARIRYDTGKLDSHRVTRCYGDGTRLGACVVWAR